jgi:hypothetical protein
MKKLTFKQRFSTLNPLAVFYYFCATVVMVRGGILLMTALNHIPGIFVKHYHIHHFVFGFLLLILTLDESCNPRFKRWVIEIMFGVALGLIFDEFAFWTFGRFDYWSISNLLAVATLSMVAGVLSEIYREPFHINFQHKKTRKAVNLGSGYSFGWQVILPWASFVGLMLLFFSIK